MWRAGAEALWSHWRRHPGQALTLVVGLALATALWTGVQAINAEARASYERAAELVGQSSRPSLVSGDGLDIPPGTYVTLRRAGWAVAPVLEGTLRIDGRNLTLVGLDPLSMPLVPGGPATSDSLPRLMGSPGMLYAAPGTIATLDAAELPPLEPEPDLAPATLIGDIGTVARLLGQPQGLTRLILLETPADPDALARLAPGLVQTTSGAEADLGGLTGSFHLNLTAFGLLAFAVGLFIVYGAIGLAFEQRRGMLRTLRALGMPARVLLWLLGAETLAVAILAGTIGIGLGYLIAAALLPDVAATLSGLYGAPSQGTLALRPGWIAAGMAMALLGTGVASAQTLWRLSRLGILASAQPRAWAMARADALRWQAAVGASLCLAAGLIGLGANGLIAGFATLGALLMGAALLLPPVLSVALSLGARIADAPVVEWFWADTRQQLPGLSTALMALFLALAANIGVSTMVGSFRATFTGWLDQRLVAELYINAGSPEKADEIAPVLQERSRATLPRISTEAMLDGIDGEIEGLSDDATYRDHWPLVAAAPDAWDALARGEGLFINEQLANRRDIGLGDSVTLDGEVWPVRAIYSDYGNPRSQAIIGLDAFAARFPDLKPQRFALRIAPANMEGLSSELRNRFGLRPDQIVDQGAIKAASLRIFEQTFAVTAALNVLTLSVAAIAILTSLLTLATLRLPQIAPVWALGLTRRQIGWLELLRAAALALFTAVLAVPLGLLLAWVLLAVVNVAAFGWRLPMQVFPLDWFILAGLAVLAATLAAAWPARRLVTRPPADLLRIFASER